MVIGAYKTSTDRRYCKSVGDRNGVGSAQVDSRWTRCLMLGISGFKLGGVGVAHARQGDRTGTWLDVSLPLLALLPTVV